MKNELRKVLKEKRKALSKEEVKEKSLIICEKLEEELKDFDKIGLYMPFQNEVDVTYYIEKHLSDKKIYLPVVLNDTDMEFVEYDENWVENRFHILEPVEKNFIQKHELEAIVVPLVGFNESNYRIGQGKGYYDRYLQDLSGTFIGVAYEFQKVNFHFEEKHDIKLKKTLTEKD